MSFFFIPKKKIIVDCFTADINAYQVFPIEKANKFIPKWMKSSASTFNLNGIDRSTIKRCSGIIDYYKQGIILPMWCDLNLIINNGGYSWEFSNSFSSADNHAHQQWDCYVNPNEFGHLKLFSPWRFKTKESISWYAIKPTWNFSLKEEYHIPSGALNFKYQSTTNVNILIDIRKNTKFVIEAGQPMTHYIPLSDRPIELRHHLVSSQEFIQLSPGDVKFIGSYLEVMNQAKIKERKCPFSK